MKPKEQIEKFYNRECIARRVERSQDGVDAWWKVFKHFDPRDVDAALDAWRIDSAPTGSGRPRGAFLPEPAELKPLVIVAQRRREAAAQEPKDFVVWSCVENNCRRGHVSGVTRKDAGRRIDCSYCGRPMHEVSREPNNYKRSAA